MLQTLNGVLTNTSSAEGSSAGYTFANLGNPVSEIGGTFVLQSGKGGQGGAAGFILFNELANGLLTPDSAFHMAIFRKGWNLTYYLNNPVPFAAIDDPNRITSPTFGSGTFSSPLAADTTLTFSASFNIAAYLASVIMPVGKYSNRTRVRTTSRRFSAFMLSKSCSRDSRRLGAIAQRSRSRDYRFVSSARSQCRPSGET